MESDSNNEADLMCGHLAHASWRLLVILAWLTAACHGSEEPPPLFHSDSYPTTGGTTSYQVTVSAGIGNTTEVDASGTNATGGTSSATGSGVGGSENGAALGGSAASSSTSVQGLSWPIDCIPNKTCGDLSYPDIDKDGEAFNCDAASTGHEGTAISITSAQQDAGTAVWAAADGVVLFAFDGKYDHCPSTTEPDCQSPTNPQPGSTTGTTVCTPLGPYCGTGTWSCFWCFSGGNVIVIRHTTVPGVFATRYDNLKCNSVLVSPGDTVKRGQKIAEVGSAGYSAGPHLDFIVWGTGFYELADPWAGPCGPNFGPSLWSEDPPWGGA